MFLIIIQNVKICRQLDLKYKIKKKWKRSWRFIFKTFCRLHIFAKLNSLICRKLCVNFFDNIEFIFKFYAGKELSACCTPQFLRISPIHLNCKIILRLSFLILIYEATANSQLKDEFLLLFLFECLIITSHSWFIFSKNLYKNIFR